MTEHLSRFARALRGAGVSVSVAEVLDAARSVRAAGITDRETFRLALRAAVVKSAEGQPIFDTLFDAYFHVPWPAGEAGERKKRRRQRPSGEPDPKRAGAGRGQTPLPAETPRPGAMSQDDGRKPGAEPHGEPEEPRRAGLIRELREESEREHLVAQGRARQAAERMARSKLGRKPLWQRPTPEEARALDREVERLGRLLRTRHGRRQRRSAQGRLDLRATVTQGVRTGGVPFKLLRRRRRITRPRLLVLCDVSGSVIRTARLLLRLLHETHRLFDRTAGFVFVDRPVPAAPLFRHADFDDALEALEALPGLDLHALSDFGNAFVRLLTDHAELLTPRTSLLVLGDARCNRFDPQVWALEEIARRVAHVVWLNPERRDRWYSHDSRLREYQPWLEHLLPAETAEELAAGIDRLCRLGA